jgi:hypothetical protein
MQSHVATLPISSLLARPDGDPQTTGAAAVGASDWIYRTVLTGPSGRPVTTHLNRDVLLSYCPELPPRGDITRAATQACLPKLQGLNLRTDVQYQPASHFWIIQTVESVLFLGLAAVLVAVAVLAVTRRRPT